MTTPQTSRKRKSDVSPEENNHKQPSRANYRELLNTVYNNPELFRIAQSKSGWQHETIMAHQEVIDRQERHVGEQKLFAEMEEKEGLAKLAHAAAIKQKAAELDKQIQQDRVSMKITQSIMKEFKYSYAAMGRKV